MNVGRTDETVEIRRDHAAGRFEVVVDGVVAGFADYDDDAGVRTFPHTVVSTEYGGRGLAGQMIGDALEATRDEGLKVRPSCSYVARYIEKNLGSADLA